MNLRVYEMAQEAERRVLYRQAERGWQAEQAAALQPRRSTAFLRSIASLLSAPFRRSNQWRRADEVANQPQSARLRGDVPSSRGSLARGSWQRASCAPGD
jgi:hypothetical protein